MKLKPIIFGATGMVGEGVLLTSLRDPDVESILVVGRKPCGITHAKLTEIIHGDIGDLSSVELRLSGSNACFFCLGVSSVGMNEADYTRITYNLTMHVASTLSRLNPLMTFCYISGTGTDSTERGSSMWARIKGKTENNLLRLPFKAVYLFRPGLMKPVAGQKNVPWFLRLLAIPFPLWRLIAAGFVCTLHDLAHAMINASLNGYEKSVLENRDITTLARERIHSTNTRGSEIDHS